VLQPSRSFSSLTTQWVPHPLRPAKLSELTFKTMDAKGGYDQALIFSGSSLPGRYSIAIVPEIRPWNPPFASTVSLVSFWLVRGTQRMGHPRYREFEKKGGKVEATKAWWVNKDKTSARSSFKLYRPSFFQSVNTS
jgi:hypothetical protein